MAKNKFQFYEVVEIHPKNVMLDLSDINKGKFDWQSLVGKKAVIMAMIQADDGSGDWLYEIDLIPRHKSGSFCIREKDLVSTGLMKKREDFYTGESIKVRVNSKTGEGEIVDEEDDK